MTQYFTPGVYIDEHVPSPVLGVETGVPLFFGLTGRSMQSDQPEDHVVSSIQDFQQKFAPATQRSYLSMALRGFFANGGGPCFVYPLRDISQLSLRRAITAIESWDNYDLICAPDIMLHTDFNTIVEMQRMLLEHSDRQGHCFAILDAVNSDDPQEVIRQRSGLRSNSGALYYPWIRVLPDARQNHGTIPACGHIAGIYAQTDNIIGIHKAPANEELVDVIELSQQVDRTRQSFLNPMGINCLRQFYGRGIRVWGARTLSNSPEWRYVNVRRLVIMISRWCELNFAGLVFEVNQQRLWQRIQRSLSSYLRDLHRLGALRGSTPTQAFYVRCDSSTNPPEARNKGMVVTEIGIAPTVPGEFIVLHIVHNNSGFNVVRSKRP